MEDRIVLMARSHRICQIQLSVSNAEETVPANLILASDVCANCDVVEGEGCGIGCQMQGDRLIQCKYLQKSQNGRLQNFIPYF